MSDSGLEADSISSHEIMSEHSNINFEITECSSIKNISDEIHTDKQICNHESLLSSNKYCKLFINDACRAKNSIQSVSNNKTYFATEYQLAATLEDAQKTKLNSNEIFQHENRVLSEPLYKTDDIDEDECFEFIKPAFAGNDNHQEISKKYKLEQKIHSDIEKLETTTVKIEFDHSHPNNIIDYNNSSASGSYFIDASSLNDEIDIISTNVTKDQYINNSISLPCFSLSSNYINYTVNKSDNDTMEGQSHKFKPLKNPIMQTRYEREFEQELKLTEYLQLSSESHKVKQMDSALEEIVNINKVANKIASKESLIVETKKIDGEKNAHSSSSLDTKISSDQDKKMERSTKIKTIENESKNNSIANENKRSLFIRRNTFELDSNDEKLSILRQEYERRQGTLVFQNAIPQYSGHRVDGDSLCHISSGISPITESLINFASEIQITNVHRPIPYLFKDCKYENNQIQMQKNSLQNNLNRSCTIYPITKSASDKLMNYDTELDDASNCSNSLPITLDSILNKNDRMKNKKKNRRDETTPIISGGVNTSDYFELLDNPIMRHKTECTPIVSGGSVIMHNSEIKAESSKMSSSLTTWVIDMSDCNKAKSKFQNNSQNMSQSFSTSECIKQSIQKTKNHEKCGSLGFFVNLKDVNDVDLDQNNQSFRKKEQDACKSYCEFYIDISDKNDDSQIKPEKQDISIENNSYNENEKKNIFSMFIDLNNSCKSNKNVTYGQNFPTVSNKLDIETADNNSKINNDIMADNFLSRKKKEEKTKPSVFMFIESDSPVIKRRVLSTSRPTFKRHSWNVDKVQSANDDCIEKELIFRKEHKRAHSISMDNRSDSKQSPTIDGPNHSLTNMIKTETHNDTNFKILRKHKYDSDNIDSNNINISFDNIFEFEIKNTPPNSHVEIENEELHVNMNCEYKKVISDYVENPGTIEPKVFENQFSKIPIWKKAIEEQNDKSETFDISTSSESLDNDNRSYKLLNGRALNINNKSQIITAANNNKISETCKSLNEAIKKIECELKEPEKYNNTEQIYDCCPENDKISNLNLKILNSDKKNSCNFVRLSDLDIKPSINHAMNVLMVNDDNSICRMNSNIPETSWIENKLVTTRNISIKPISKKLVSVMSTSLPCKQKSPVENLIDEGEGIISESDLSSMQSSMGRSGAGMYIFIYFLELQLIIIIMMILMKIYPLFCIFLCFALYQRFLCILCIYIIK